jgi:hypothetical protein
VTNIFQFCAIHAQYILRGLPHLVKYMPEPKDSRLLIPDPANEPDLYAISSEYPLPDDPDFHMAVPVEESEEPKKRAASATVAAPRLASEAAWFDHEMPPAKRPAFERNTDAIKGAAAAAAPRIHTVPAPEAIGSSPYAFLGRPGAPTVSASAISRFQDTMNSPPEQLSWFNDQMPPGRMYNILSHVPLAPPTTSSMSQLQDAISLNNQLMALQAQHQLPPQQQLPELSSNNPLMAEIVAAMLRSRGL